MSAYFNCKICGGVHPSPLDFGSKESFDDSKMLGESFNCPIRQSAIYDKEDMFWKEEN